MRTSALVVTGLLLLAGTVSADQQGDSATAQGGGHLTVYSADAAHGLAGQYRAPDGTTVWFETMRQPGHAEGDGGDSRDYEVVARFYDDYGMTLASHTDGHDLPDAWAGSRYAGPGGDPEPAMRAAVQAGRRLAALTTNREVAVERRALSALAAQIADGLSAQAQQAQRQTDSTTLLSTATTCTYSQRVAFKSRRETYYVFPNVWDSFNYDHVASYIYYFKNCGGTYTFYDAVRKCNHKGCDGTTLYTQYDSPYRAHVPVPYSCDDNGGSFSYADYRHLSANDAFLELGNIMAGYRNSYDTYTRICWNKNYTSYVGRSYKSRPWVGDVINFINKYGWYSTSSGGSGGGGSGGSEPTPPDEPYCGPNPC